MIRNILICLLFISAFGGFAQQKPPKKLLLDTTYIKIKQFNGNHLKKYKKQKDFVYNQDRREKNILEKIYQWANRVFQKFLTWLFGVEKATGLISTFFRALPYFILALCLFIITKFFIKLNTNSLTRQSMAKKGEILLFDEEKLLKSENLDELLNQAIADNNFRLAIRYEYLKILKYLSQLKLIDWQVQKTNDDYYSELSQQALKPMFKQSTLLYDYVWYGNFKINQNHYAKIKVTLDQFLTKINQFEQVK